MERSGSHLNGLFASGLSFSSAFKKVLLNDNEKGLLSWFILPFKLATSCLYALALYFKDNTPVRIPKFVCSKTSNLPGSRAFFCCLQSIEGYTEFFVTFSANFSSLQHYTNNQQLLNLVTVITRKFAPQAAVGDWKSCSYSGGREYEIHPETGCPGRIFVVHLIPLWQKLRQSLK